MKKIVVIDEKCNACGMCTMECILLKETTEGKAEVILPGIISENMIKQVENIVNMCPAQALQILEVEQGKSKKQVLAELKLKVEEPLNLLIPSQDNYAFNKSEYTLPILGSPNEYRYNYKSYKSAESEGLSDFRDRIYSQKVAIAQQIIISYKHDKLLKFIKYEECNGNYKYETNKKLENKLREYVTEIEAYLKEKFILEESFFYFNTRDTYALELILKYGVDNGWAQKIASEVHSYDWFDTWIESDELSTLVEKKSWFSSNVEYEEKDMYCFKLAGASKELNNQILYECQNCIPELSNGHVESELEQYHKLLKIEWNQKIQKLVEKIDEMIVNY